MNQGQAEPQTRRQRFECWVGIQPGERTLAYSAFAAQLLLGAGHAELEMVRDTAFLTRLTAKQLPFMYMGVAVLGIGMAELSRRSRSHWHRFGLVLYMMVGALLTLGFSVVPASDATVYALYLWTALCAPWVQLQLSLHLANELSIAQAKRLLSFIGAGSVLGALLGSFSSRVTLMFASPIALLYGAFAFFAATALALVRLLKPREVASANARASAPKRHAVARTARAEANQLLRDRYGRGLLLLMGSSTIALTLVDYLFKSEASARFTDAHDLSTFLSSVQVSTNLLSLVVQLGATAGILRLVGAHAALLLLPTFLLGGSALVMTGARFAGILALRGADGMLRYSLHRTALDLLYFPLPDSVRRRMKPMLEILGQRGGQTMAGALLIGVAALPITHAEERLATLWVLALLLLAWIVAVVKLRRPYVDLFRDSLVQGAPVSRLTDRELELPMLEATLTSLSSAQVHEVIAAIDLLASFRRGRLLPALLLYHPDPAVLQHALPAFAAHERSDVVPLIDRLLDHEDTDVRTAALRARIDLEADRALMERYVDDPRDRAMAATAMVGLLARGWMSPPRAEELLDQWIAARAQGFVRPIAEAARLTEARTALQPLLLRCLRAAVTQREQAQVASALAEHPTPQARDALIALLEFRIPREGARAALIALGDDALEELARKLANAHTPHALRRHLPETLRRFPGPRALQVLQRALPDERDGMVRFKLLRSLNRMQRQDPSLAIDTEMVSSELERTLARLQRLDTHRRALRRGFLGREHEHRSRDDGTLFSWRSASLELLSEILEDKVVQGTERVLRLVSLLRPRQDFRLIALSLRSRGNRRRAGALEVLAAEVPVRFREDVLYLVHRAHHLDGGSTPWRAQSTESAEAALHELVHTEPGTLRALALHVATELEYPWVEQELSQPIPAPSPSAIHLYESMRARQGPPNGPHSERALLPLPEPSSP